MKLRAINTLSRSKKEKEKVAGIQITGLLLCCLKLGIGGAWRLMRVTPELWETEVGRSPEVKSLRPDRPTWRNPVSTKNTKISQAWWHMLVVLATQEAEAGKLLEPGR